MTTILENRLLSQLADRRQNSRLRGLVREAPQVDFWSNDYLGLARNRGLAERVRVASDQLQEPPLGSTGSRLISGNSPLAEDLERQIARRHGFSAGLLYSSGYQANVGLLSCVAERGDAFFLDELAHASMIDGTRLSVGKRHKFAHNDLEDLAARLRHARGQTFVVVESVYSMDGDQAPLSELAALCEEHAAALIVDEAHGIGVVGEHGEGLVSHLKLQNQVFACVYTFGKAPGCHGAVVAGSGALREFLINFSRPFIYTTAPSPAAMVTMAAAHEALFEADSERQRLRARIEEFRREASAQCPFPLIDSQSAIQSVVVSGDEAAIRVANHLWNQGFAAKAILSPTVARGSERLRICLHSFNTSEEIHALVNSLREASQCA